MDATALELRTLAEATQSATLADAARKLGVDKATVGRRLASLERAHPGLFERRGGRVEPTAAGARAIEALGAVDASLARLRSVLARDGDSRGAVRLTLPAPVASRVVVPETASFSRQHPGIDLVLLATSRVLDVAAGEADVAVRNVPPTGAGIVARRVATTSYALYASREYVRARGALVGRDLDGHDFLDFEAGTPRQAPLDWLPAAVQRARVVLRADDPVLLTQAAVAGLGVAALPTFLADDERELRRLSEDVVVSSIHVVVREEVRRLARVRAVATWVGDLLQTHLAWLDRTRCV